jgi:L,D-transpeptidase catalytic domain
MARRLAISIACLATLVGSALVTTAILRNNERDSAAASVTVVADQPTGRAAGPERPPLAEPVALRPDGRVPSVGIRPARGPYFSIVRLLPGKRVAVSRHPGGTAVTWLGPRTEFGSPVVLAVDHRRGGWIGFRTPLLPNGVLGWARFDPKRMQLYWTKYSLGVDLSQRSLEIRYGKETVSRFTVTVGGAGSETPLGRFAITDALTYDSSPYYGCCALALSGHQPNLPAGWIGGNRLAIHGTPGPVGLAASAGCVRATDATMQLLFSKVPLGTPVFVSG